MPDSDAPIKPAGQTAVIVRVAILAAVLVLGAAGFVLFGGDNILRELASREAQLRLLVCEHPVAALCVAFVVYVLVTGLSLPGAAALSLLYGWLFGFWPALVLVSFASTAGATIAFLLSRFLFGTWIQARHGQRLAAFNAAIDRDGAFYLFTLRLIPQVPFFVINAVMGLTKLRTTTFWWVSQLGMLPGTCIFVLAGASVPSLNDIAKRGLASVLDWRLMSALVLLGIVPLALRWFLNYFRPRRASDAGAGND